MVSAGIEFFFIVSGVMLCFRFRRRMVLITYWFSCCTEPRTFVSHLLILSCQWGCWGRSRRSWEGIEPGELTSTYHTASCGGREKKAYKTEGSWLRRAATVQRLGRHWSVGGTLALCIYCFVNVCKCVIIVTIICLPFLS